MKNLFKIVVIVFCFIAAKNLAAQTSVPAKPVQKDKNTAIATDSMDAASQKELKTDSAEEQNNALDVQMMMAPARVADNKNNESGKKVIENKEKNNSNIHQPK